MGEKKDDNWEMPQPVFKSSEGSLPRSLEETISTSFMANAETIEIDEDDDILGIMDASFADRRIENLVGSDEEDILETGSEIEAVQAPRADNTNESDVDLKSDDPTSDPEQSKPIAVKAKESVEDTDTKSGGSGSGLFVYVVLALVAVVLAVLYYYFVQNK